MIPDKVWVWCLCDEWSSGPQLVLHYWWQVDWDAYIKNKGVIYMKFKSDAR